MKNIFLKAFLLTVANETAKFLVKEIFTKIKDCLSKDKENKKEDEKQENKK